MDTKLLKNYIAALSPKNKVLKEATIQWQKMPNKRKLAFVGGTLMGSIEFFPGTPDVIPGSKDQYSATIKGKKRDSKLKMDITTFNTIGYFSTEAEAVSALTKAINALK